MKILACRFRYFAETVVITLGVILGAIWPSYFTLGAVVVLPAVAAGLVGAIHPTWMRSKPWLGWYVDGAAILALIMLALEMAHLIATN